MKYDTSSMLDRSRLSHYQKRMLACGAFVAFLVVSFFISTFFKPYLGPLPILDLRQSMRFGQSFLLSAKEKQEAHQMHPTGKGVTEPICDFSEERSDVCEINGDLRIHGNSSTIFIVTPKPYQRNTGASNSSSCTIIPYARKGDRFAMGNVRKFTIEITTSAFAPRCTRNHTVPAVVFSSGGYAGNQFHDFSDLIVPLYLTSRRFDGEVEFLVSQKRSWWTNKYEEILRKLSRYDVVDVDGEDGVICFENVTVGLRSHMELDIDSSRSPYSMADFRDFLRASYSLQRRTASRGVRPRLLIISRNKTRSFINVDEIAGMAAALGFDVVVQEAGWNLKEFAKVVNSCDVMMGVHGAGLTNILFLPDDAVFIQVVPLGGMEFLAAADFGRPAKHMNLNYLDYNITPGESSLIHGYPPHHPVFKDPYSYQRKDWISFRQVFLDNQNVKLDLARFRPTLLHALHLLRP